MKKVKSFFKKISSVYCRYVNGVKGSVSIFLALVLSPMLSLSLLLVETSRMQNTIQALEDIVDAAGLSTLADYDTYIDSRFGLLATNQKEPVLDQFRSYIDTNLSLLGSDITARGQATAKGEYPLSDIEVLKRQILDYSEFTVPVELVLDGFDVKGMLQDLQDALIPEKLTAIMNTVDKAAGAANDTATMIAVIKELYDGVNTYITKKSEYAAAAGKFESALDALKEAYEAKEAADAAKEAADAAKSTADSNLASVKQAAKDNESNNFVQDKVTDVGDSVAILQAQGKVDKAQKAVDAADAAVRSAAQSVSSAKTAAVKAAGNYATDAKEFADAIDTVITKSEEGLSKAEGVITGLQETKSGLESYNKAKAKENNKGSSGTANTSNAANSAGASSYDSTDWLLDVTQSVVEIVEKAMTDEVYNGMRKDKETLLDQKDKLNRFTGSDITSSAQLTPVSGYMKSKGYEKKDINTMDEGLASELDAKSKEINNNTFSQTIDGISIEDIIEDCGEVIDKLTGLSFFTDTSLDAAVSYSDASAMSVTDQLVIDAVRHVLQAFEDIKSAIADFTSGSLVGLFTGLCDIVTAIANLLIGIVEFITALISWVAEFGVGIAKFLGQLFSNPGELYNEILVCGYSVYNFPNRTNYATGSALTGASYANLCKRAIQAGAGGGSSNKYQTLTELIKGEGGNVTFGSAGDCPMFLGAVAEYLFVGSPCEQSNQMATFFNMYILRMVLDLVPLLTCDDVKYAASLAGPFSWAVYLACILIEPFVDTTMLVNGGKQPLWKKQDGIYCSFEGISKGIIDIIELTTMPNGLKEEVKNAEEEKIKKGRGQDKIGDDKKDAEELNLNKGLLEVSYTEHIFLLMMGRFVGNQMFSENDRLDKLLTRIKNVIDMESKVYYEHILDGEPFDITKTYTYVKGTVPYTSHPLFRFDIIPNGGEFNATVTRYCGY